MKSNQKETLKASAKNQTRDLSIQALTEWGMDPVDVGKVFQTALRYQGSGNALAELFFEDSLGTRLIFEGGRVDRITQGRDRGVGFRILYSGKSVYGYTTDLSEEALLKLAETLSEATQGNAEDLKGKKKYSQPNWYLGVQKDSEIASYAPKKSPTSLPMAEKIRLVTRAETAARKKLPEAKQVTSFMVDSLRKILVMNSEGLISKDSKTYLQMMVQVVGEKNGRVETAYESQGGYVGLEFFESVSPESIGESAAQRVGILLTAKPAPAGTMPVVISADAGGTMIHEAVGHGLEADLACNGLSVYQNQLGKTVASPLITVIDDGTMPERRGSYCFDDEGTPAQKNVLIENGVLKSYMVDRLSAMKFDMMATGNGRRESFRNKPIVRMTNTYIAPGKDDPHSILKDTEWGIFVKAMGGGQVNTVTGDFVFAVTEGYLVHNGNLGSPIRGATLVGNGPKVLSIVDRVGNDLGFATGTCGKDGQGAPVTDAQPTLRIPELTVGGEVSLKEYWHEKGE